jgi:GNAT superfamily N-acetyltransferase
VLSAAPVEYTLLAGSAERALAVLNGVWPRRGHSASFEHALVAEVDGQVVGVLIAFPARARYRLHGRLLIAGVPRLSPLRWPLLAVALPLLVLASPRPPRAAYYVATIAVAPNARRRRVAFALGDHAERAAAAGGFERIVAHTGTCHAVARRALERYGLELVKWRRVGYALYGKPVSGGPPTAVLHNDR